MRREISAFFSVNLCVTFVYSVNLNHSIRLRLLSSVEGAANATPKL
jgi:hypothetical protein